MTSSDEKSATAADSWIGRVLSDRYRILQLLGEGGMGAVYLAEHTHMRKRVALKLLHAEMSENAEVLARFEREAMAAARIEHPNVAAATDFGRTGDGSFFLVLEYVEGASLRKVLDGGALGAARALHVTRQMASALAHAHEAGIVHRDLKPENVMLIQRGTDRDFVKVLDFGIAKVDTPEPREGAPAAQPLTRVGTLIGTPEYMAPEQALGEAVTPQSDLYAVGVMLYEMLTGKHPFDAPDRMAILSFHIVAPVPAMRDRAPEVDVPPIVEAIARKLLGKDAKERPESARALVAEIDAAAGAIGLDLRGPTSGALPPSTPAISAAMPVSGPSPRSLETPRESHSSVANAMTGGSWAAEDSFAKTSHGEAAPTPEAMAALPTALAGQAARAAAPPSTSPLEAALATVKTWPRPMQIGVLAAPVVGFLLVVIVVLASRGSTVADAASSVDGGSGGSLLPSTWTLPGTRASEEKLKAAERDVTALEGLRKDFPEDPRVLGALAVAYHAEARSADALRTVRALLDKKAPGPLADDIVDLVVEIATKGKGEDDDDAYALLEGPLGEKGVDALIEMSALATNGGRVNATRTRAKASLAKPEVRAKASAAAGILLDLRAAKDCAKKRELLDRARDDGDSRILSTLKTMRSTRGCGFAGLRDCWPCLRGGPALDDAIAAVEKRAPPAAAGSARPAGRR